MIFVTFLPPHFERGTVNTADVRFQLRIRDPNLMKVEYYSILILFRQSGQRTSFETLKEKARGI
jgi:hypothetical protein